MNITESDIRHNASNSSTFLRGINYYIENRVRNFYYNELQQTAHANVVGEYTYNVEVSFGDNGEITYYECDCPAFMSYEGACKHIVAVIKFTQAELLKNNSFSKLRTANNGLDIFTYFDELHQGNIKKEVQIEINYELEHSYKSMISAIDMKLGEERLYVVRNMREFLESIDKESDLEFGKRFIFRPTEHSFSPIDQSIINLLLEIYDGEKMLEGLSTSFYRHETAFKGKKVYLSPSQTIRLLSILKNKSFSANILGKEVSNISILERDIPLAFQLYEEQQKMCLQLETEGTLIPITKKGEYIFYEENIYQPTEEQRRYFLPFYQMCVKGNKKKIDFSSKDKGRFVSEILPYIKKISNVRIDPKIAENILEENLGAKIYFDKMEDGISAKVEFQYGEEIIHPFEGESKLYAGKKVIARDMIKEKQILSFFEEADFKVSKDKVFIKDQDKIFDFLTKRMNELHKLAEIYYSDEFKKITVKEASPISLGVRLNNDSSMLEVSFEYQEMDPREMNDILAAYRSRKKYFRLGNGAFLSLTNTEFEKVADIIDYLELNDKDLSKKLIELPQYRAIYLDEILREAQLSSVHKNQAFKSLVQNIKEPQDMEFSLPKELDPILRDYQKTGFRWLKTLAEYGMGGILADDMGLGKTLQILAFICSEKEKKLGPSLVIAPTSLVYNWQDEAQKFVPSMKIVVISGDPKERHELLQEIDQADLIITSYPLIRRDIELYETVEFAYCILDEAQHIKNPSSLNAKTVKQIKAKGYYGLTGTPIENSLSEMWSIFDFVMPGYLLSHGKFVKKYEKPIIRDQNNKIMNQLVKQIRPFILRRLKKDVAKELPEKIETKVITELTEEQKKLYLAYLQEAKTTVDNEIYTHGFEKSQMKILALLTRLRQICCHPSLFLENYQGDSCKLLLLEDIVQDAKKSGHRILLFSQFTSMLDIIRKKLNGMGIEYFYLDGAVKAQDRRDMVSAFQQGNKDIFLISLKAGGTGLNLTGADMVIHFDPWWNPAVEEQATDRAYRIGQKNSVQVFKFITKGTIEEKIYELQKKKKSLIDSVIQPGETLISKMKEAEIRELFEL